MAASKGRQIGVWIILGLLFVGLIGFGTTNLTGGASRLGTVGDQEITLNEYAQGLTQQIRAFEAQIGQPLSFSQAQSFGLDQAVLGQIVAAKSLDQEAQDLGISAGDARVRDEVLSIQAFQGLDGEFDREAYRSRLEAEGMTEAEFEEGIREEYARSLLQQAALNGVPAPQDMAATIASHALEERDFSWASVTPALLPEEVPAPDAAALQRQYDENPERYTTPERRRLTYAWITPAAIQDEVTVDEEALRGLYQDRIDEFVQPERRLVERLVYPNVEAAEEAVARLEAGEADFDALVEARGLGLEDVDMGDVAREELGAAGDRVFAAEPNAVVGPVETDLGPALFRVNAILNAQETTFEEARPDLREELAQERARRIIDDMRGQVEDLLAGGASPENIAEETDLQLDTMTWEEGQSGGLADYAAFREAAAATAPGDFPELTELADGGLVALRVDEVIEPELQPFEEVAPQVTDDAMAAATREAVLARAEEIAAEIEGGASFAEAGLDPRRETGITRRGFLEGTPPTFLATVFAMDEGAAQAVPNGQEAIVVRVDGIAAPDPEGEAFVAERERIAERAAQGIARDLFNAYSGQVQRDTEVRIDESAVSAVNQQFR